MWRAASAALAAATAAAPRRLLATAAASPSTSLGGAMRAFSSSSMAAHDGGGGPVLLVFGASGGIGSALAERLAASSLSPSALVLSAQHQQQLDELAQRLRGKGRPAVHTMAADATDPDAVDALVGEVLSRHGRLDGVVNTVGNVVARSALATDLHQLQDTLAVNLYSSFNVLRASVRAMLAGEHSGEMASQQQGGGDSGGGDAAQQHSNEAKRRGGGGSIVLVSAAVASHGLPNYEAMSAAKAAVEGLARSAAATYAQHNVRINCVAPGLTTTLQTRKMTETPRVSDVSQQMHPLKELATPQQVASALEFFLRPENDFITGQVLAVDGGLSTLHPHRAEDYGV